MSDDLRFRIRELFGEARACDFLSFEEVEALAEGRLEPARLEEFERHAESCAACDTLRADLASFSAIEEKGLLEPEKRAFHRTEGRVRATVGLGPPARARMHLVYISLLPAAAVVLLALFFLPGLLRPTLIESLPEVPLTPPPIVRGPALAEVWSDAAEAWERDDMAAAIGVLGPAVETWPDDAPMRFYLGLARLRAGDAPGAVEALETADRLEKPPSETVRWALVAALERASRFDEACEALRSVADLGGERADEARRIADESCPPAR
jgi:cytochrome c-type biogenesis protein CcmH/NrfG